MNDNYFTIDIVHGYGNPVMLLCRHQRNFKKPRFAISADLAFAQKIIDASFRSRDDFLKIGDKWDAEEFFLEMAMDGEEYATQDGLQCDILEKAVDSDIGTAFKERASKFYEICIKEKEVKCSGIKEALADIPFSLLGMKDFNSMINEDKLVLPFIEMDDLISDLEIPFL